MCGCYALDLDVEIETRFGVTVRDPLLSRFNIAPSTQVPVITGADPILELMRWGMTPSWLPAAERRRGIINVRVETLATKRTFHELFARQRCLVPASGYYEWMRANGSALPYFIRPKADGLVAFAGIYERDSDGTRHCAILTTSATPELTTIHDRMPVVLSRDAEHLWLDPDATANELLARCAPSVSLISYPVSTAVNRVSSDGPDLIVPLDDRPRLL